MMDERLSALNVNAGLYYDAAFERTFPITDWIDSDGDICEFEEAVACIAGEPGLWFVIPLSDFSESATTH
jgi:hypothetical protein